MGGHVRPRLEIISEAVAGCRGLVAALDAESKDRMKVAASLELSSADASEETDDVVLTDVLLSLVEDLAYYDADPTPGEAAELIDDDDLRARIQAALARLEKLASEP